MAGARYALAMLFVINLTNFFDRQILGAVGEQIRREWGLGDTALGALGTAFTLLYAVVAASRTVRHDIDVLRAWTADALRPRDTIRSSLTSA